ncbi:MAG: hypothetical protein ACYC3G_01315 [Minisyncoccota bacterium]
MEKNRVSKNKRQAPSPERALSKFLYSKENYINQALKMLTCVWFGYRQKRKAFDARLVRGQVMMIVVMVLSAVIIGATAVAGILTARQTRQTVDAGNFSKVLFAADSGFGWRLYKFYQDKSTCKDNEGNTNDCPAGKACNLKPDFSSDEIELSITCETMEETGNKTCPIGFDCWTINSSATKNKNVSSKETSYVFSRDISVSK